MVIGIFSERQTFVRLMVLIAGAVCVSLFAGLRMLQVPVPVNDLVPVIGLDVLLVLALWDHYRTLQKLTYLQNVLDAAPSGLLSVDRDGVIQFANPTACSIFNYTNENLVGRSVEILVPNQLRQRHPGLRGHFLQEGRSRRMGEGRDIRGVTRDGREIPLEIGLTHLGSGDKTVVIVGVIDIRELKEAKSIIERQNQNLARSVKELEQFAFVASHDLREPLRKVMNYSEILEEDYGSEIDDDGRQVLSSVRASVQRMEGLLDSLLNYSRVTTKAQPLEAVSLQSVLAEVVDDLSLLISDNEATVEYDDLPVVLGDRNQLRQLFQNLISNSLKYKRDGVPPRIRVDSGSDPTLGPGRGYCGVKVMDNGIGFDNQYAEMIFDVFKRLHGRDKYQGTGMGLAICRKIVERHDGYIHADGDVNTGATFTVWLHKGKLN